MIKNYRWEAVQHKGKKNISIDDVCGIFRLMIRVVSPELPHTENSFTPLSPVALMGLSTREFKRKDRE